MKATNNKFEVSNQTAAFISALHIEGAKFYDVASNAISNTYSEESPVFKEFSAKYFELQAILEKCIIDSIADNQSAPQSTKI